MTACLLYHTTFLVLLVGFAHADGGTLRRGLIPFPRVGRSSPSSESLSPGVHRANLFPFPRIGRSNEQLTWDLDDAGLHEVKRQGLIPFPRVGKRQSLIPFPRVGRSSYAPLALPMYFRDVDDVDDAMSLDVDGWEDEGFDDVSKRTNGGMWFGPRLGRRNKRSLEEKDSSSSSFNLANLLKNPWVLMALKELSEGNSFTPRLGRESGELTSSSPRGTFRREGLSLIPDDLQADERRYAPRHSRSTNQPQQQQTRKQP